MGKKRRILTNPKKFGKKHFEFLDNMDGTDDNIISSTKVSPTLRTLNLVDNGDRTVKITAELFGSGSAIDTLRYLIIATGGVNLSAPITGSEEISIGTAAPKTGFPYASSKPALVDGSGNVYVLPKGPVTIKALVADSTDFPTAFATGHASATDVLTEEITIGSAPIGLPVANLSSSLSSTDALTFTVATDSLSGSGPQHGSGSGVGSTQVYSVQDTTTGGPGHGFHLAASGSETGSLNLSDHGGTATTANGNSSNSAVVILQSSSVAALNPQTLTVTFTPLDVNGALSTDQAISTSFSVPFA